MTAKALAAFLERISYSEQLAQIGEWMVQKTSSEELLAEVKGVLDAY